MKRLWVVLVVVGCGSSSPSPAADAPAADAATDAPVARPDLEVTSLGVQGFAVRYGDDVVVTAPLFTRQSAFAVTLGLPLAADTTAIDAGLAAVPLDQVRAVISGHAHYDHLLDVPRLLARAPGATVFANRTAKHIFAALAPDRPVTCTSPAATTPLARARVIAMDEPTASFVDYTNCPALRPGGAPLEGTWAMAPGGRVRVKAFCSMHPDQVGPIHFGAGSVDQDLCELPRAAADWLEGLTLAFVFDFLDDAGQPIYRVFYQDAPTDAPVGHVPAATLAEHPVDLAILCVGTYDAVADQPGAIVASLAPRYVVSGHWEDFFQPIDQPPQPIPLLDLPRYLAAAEAAMPGAPDAAFQVDGMPATSRQVLAVPGMRLAIPFRTP